MSKAWSLALPMQCMCPTHLFLQPSKRYLPRVAYGMAGELAWLAPGPLEDVMVP